MSGRKGGAKASLDLATWSTIQTIRWIAFRQEAGETPETGEEIPGFPGTQQDYIAAERLLVRALAAGQLSALGREPESCQYAASPHVFSIPKRGSAPVELPPVLWEIKNAGLWPNGALVGRYPPNGAVDRYRGPVWVDCRFYASQVMALWPSPTAEAKPPVSPASLAEWLSGFVNKHRRAGTIPTLAAMRDDLDRAFPDHARVANSKFTALRKSEGFPADFRKPGRPMKKINHPKKSP